MNRSDAILKIRQRLDAGGQSVGSWMQIPDSSVAEIIGQAGYDWVAVDLEHGAIALHQLPDLFRALEFGGTLPIARLARGGMRECKEALDAGAGGVIVPMIETALQLTQVRDACRWPPAGKRGVGFSRANLFGKHFDSYSQEAQAPLLVAMIENVRAVNNLVEILEVDGLDAILIGPYDLSASIGLTGKFTHPQFLEMMDRIRELGCNKKIPVGIHVVQPSPEELRQRIDEGYQFLAYSVDAVMLRSVAEHWRS